jgi:hypothetical protein
MDNQIMGKLSWLEKTPDLMFEYGFALLLHPASWILLGALILIAWRMPLSGNRQKLRKMLLIFILALSAMACVWSGMCFGVGAFSVATDAKKDYMGIGAAVMVIGGAVCLMTAVIAYFCVKILRKINLQPIAVQERTR